MFINLITLELFSVIGFMGTQRCLSLKCLIQGVMQERVILKLYVCPGSVKFPMTLSSRTSKIIKTDLNGKNAVHVVIFRIQINDVCLCNQLLLLSLPLNY